MASSSTPKSTPKRNKISIQSINSLNSPYKIEDSLSNINKINAEILVNLNEINRESRKIIAVNK